MYPGAHAATTPDKAAVVFASTGAVQTYAELDAAANRLSRVLRGAGLHPGDHVAFCIENHPRFLEIAWGCHYAGLVYTACSSRLTSGELAYILNDCGAKAFITSSHQAAQAAEVLPAIPGVHLRLMLDGTVDGYERYDAAVARESALALPERVAGTDMLYSSGTTGLPKGVVRPFAPIPLEQAEHPRREMLAGTFRFTAASRYLSPAPLYHSAPLRYCMAAHGLGVTVIVMERFDEEDFLRLIERHGVTHTQVVPTMLVRLLKLADTVRTSYDLSSLECVIHAAAPCPVPVKRKVIDWLGPIVHEFYGGTEGNGITWCDSTSWLAHPGTVGRAVGCTVHICDDDGAEVPVGRAGTVYFASGAGFEYHNDPEKTAKSRHPKGWTTIGDIGHLDDDGFLYLTDRAAYMIISGGVNVYPQEAENVLITHPKVVDVAVFGVPHDDFGEAVKAVVQPVSMPVSEEDASSLERELVSFCRAQLADVKCPRSVDFRIDLPRHPTGKLYKRLLKDEYWAAAGRAI